MKNIKLEDLEINGYHIYQDKDSFNFGIDAVLLANFALRENATGSHSLPVREGSYNSLIREGSQCVAPTDTRSSVIKICDFCTGALPIPLIMYAKRKMILGETMLSTHITRAYGMGELCEPAAVGAKQCEPALSIDAFEIDADQASLCNKSIIWNKENVEDAKNICDDIKVFNEDIKNIFLDREKYKSIYESFDMITCNPPYNKKGSGIINIEDKKILARHEMSITFEDICKAARLLLKSNKKFYLIHHSERLPELIMTLKSNSFEVKKVQFVHPKVSKPSALVLIEAVKNAKSSLSVLEPIIIFNEDGSYTEKIQKIYGK